MNLELTHTTYIMNLFTIYCDYLKLYFGISSKGMLWGKYSYKVRNALYNRKGEKSKLSCFIIATHYSSKVYSNNLLPKELYVELGNLKKVPFFGKTYHGFSLFSCTMRI